MMLIGVDPHKSTHTATAVEPGTNQEVASIRIEATVREYQRMLIWGARWPERQWAIENAHGLGRHLASWLLARGEHVVDVPATATARVRQLSRGGGRKNDRIDAAAAACVAAIQADARPVQAEGTTDALAVLDEPRVNLAQSRVRAVNQLHALLRALLAGGAPRDLSATTAAGLLCSVRPSGATERARKAVAGELVAEIRSLDARLAANAKAIAELVKASGSTLPETVGIGPIIAGRLLSRTGRASRFPTPAAYASYTGAAPTEVASADNKRHRLSRVGDRQLNSALHTVAITQIRIPTSRGHHYYKTKIAEGKTPRGHPVLATPLGRPHLAGHGQRRKAIAHPHQGRRQDGLTNTEAPKGSDLRSFTAADLQAVETRLNDRPRKRLSWLSPTRAMEAALAQ